LALPVPHSVVGMNVFHMVPPLALRMFFSK
jgi:hypothetical protein